MQAGLEPEGIHDPHRPQDLETGTGGSETAPDDGGTDHRLAWETLGDQNEGSQAKEEGGVHQIEITLGVEVDHGQPKGHHQLPCSGEHHRGETIRGEARTQEGRVLAVDPFETTRVTPEDGGTDQEIAQGSLCRLSTKSGQKSHSPNDQIPL